MSELESMTTKTCPCGREFNAIVHKKGKHRVFCDDCREKKMSENKAAWIESLRQKKAEKDAKKAARRAQADRADELLGAESLPEL